MCEYFRSNVYAIPSICTHLVRPNINNNNSASKTEKKKKKKQEREE